MVSHDNIVNAFVNGETKLKGSRMFIDGNVIYSYGYHFPIALRLEKGVFLFNKDGYSVSTSRHKNKVKRAIEGVLTRIIEVSTDRIKKAIDLRINNSHELITKEIMEELEKGADLI